VVPSPGVAAQPERAGTAGLEFDLAISFAGENRDVAEAIAEGVRGHGFRVFYDGYEEANLWGKDLYEHFADVYQNKARFCLMLVSEHYARKHWTNHERKAAQTRVLREKQEYLLPLRLDDTEIPGLLPTIAHIDLRQKTTEEVVNLLVRKLRGTTA
jgi:hypothetical protein